jgi:ATP-binding cassette subfamily B protein
MALELRRREGQVVLDVADGRHLGAPEAAPLPRREGDTPLDPLAMRSIIERQGGRFDTVAPGPQHGLRYTLQLPLRAIDVVPWPLQPTPAEGELAGLRLVCIDDQADARESLQALLGLEGAEVQAFASGREALTWLDALPPGQWPDGLLCDIALGDEDGHDVVRALRVLEQQRDTPSRLPAIALSGLALPEDRARALAAGFQLHLAKPVDPGELVASIRAIVPGDPRVSASWP